MSKFEKQLKDELNNYTPDLKDNIKARINIPTKEKKSIKWQYVATPILAVMVLLIAIITPIMVLNPADTNVVPVVNSYKLSIKIVENVAFAQAGIDNSSPSIEITYGDDKFVDNIRPLSKNGMLILQGNGLKKFKGQKITVDSATDIIIDEMAKLGYIEATNEIKIVVKNSNGTFEPKQFSEVKTNIQEKLAESTLSIKNISQLSEEELDILEDDIEKNIDKYYQEFKEDIKVYIEAKLPIVKELLDNIFNEMKLENPTLTDMFDLKAIKKFYVDKKVLIDNPKIAACLKEYQKEYKNDIDDDIDLDSMSRRDFYDVYEDLVEEYTQLQRVYQDILDNVPAGDIDDLDDIIEDIYFPEEKDD